MERAPIDAERLQASLAKRWARVTIVDETDSTNTDLLADTQAPDRSVLVAEHQAAGRGRLDRTWTSPPRAGLTVSALFHPPVTLARWGWLPLLAGVAVHDAVRAATGVETVLKWPNDVLVAGNPDLGGKLAGILAQTAGDAVVIGIGINVSTTADELPNADATSLALAGAADVDRTALLRALLGTLDARFAQWADCDGDAAACGLADSYQQACSTLGRPVRVWLGGPEPITGDAAGIDELGRLVVRTADGSRVVGAGDVEHVRTS